MFGLFKAGGQTEVNSKGKPTKPPNIVFVSLFLLLILVSIMLFGVSGNRTASGQFTNPTPIKIEGPVTVEGFRAPYPLSLGLFAKDARVEIKVSTGETFKGRVKEVYGASEILLELEVTGERIVIVPHHIVYLKVFELPNFPKRR